VPGDHGAQIESYIIDMDDGIGGSFLAKQGEASDSLLLSLIISEGIVSGRHYRFRYRTRNEVGYGPYSDVAYILTAVKPEQPNVLEATIVESNVVVSWLMPYNGGALIYAAEIKFLNS
jgi:hypothetical protein